MAIRKPELTPKELKIVNFVCNDKSNLEIAVRLKVGLRYVEKIKSGIYLKTKTRSNVSLLKWAVINKLYQIKK